MPLPVDILFIILILCNVFFHCVGIHLLRCLKLAGKQTNEHLLLTNISAMEIFASALFLAHHCRRMVAGHTAGETLQERTGIYVRLAIHGGGLLYFFSMICVTGDKLLVIMLNIRYVILLPSVHVVYNKTGDKFGILLIRI